MVLAMLQWNHLARQIVCADANSQHVKMALELELVDEATTDPAEAVTGQGEIVPTSNLLDSSTLCKSYHLWSKRT